ncbi:MAG TPA: cadmium resistance transporter [Pyrinomonadaceae bacterium]|nr:cadmium resistance transporter [Pyrinomonadaceae bacterium]
MSWLLKALATGAVSFVATNIDDIFVLALFFGQTGKRGLRRWHIVAGQYIGFAALVAISLVGYFVRFIIPAAWIGLLGLLPIAMGVRAFVRGHQGNEEDLDARAGTGILPVAAVTFANGGDNIGIYTPLFAASERGELLVIVTAFFVLVGLWCVLGKLIGNHTAVKKSLDRYGHIIVPFVLIGLGIYIIVESGTLHLLGFGRT